MNFALASYALRALRHKPLAAAVQVARVLLAGDACAYALAGLAVKLFHSILQSTTGGLFGPPVSLPTPYFGTP